jgi:hypothetical protein
LSVRDRRRCKLAGEGAEVDGGWPAGGGVDRGWEEGGGVEVDAAVGQPGSVEAGTGVRLQGEALVVEGFAAQGLQSTKSVMV